MPAVPGWLYRGFEAQEEMTMFALINMNGRLYDPLLGRMLSPDSYVPLPWNTQGYNGYTYGNNNPLVYVDPDGNFFWLAIPLVVGTIINVADNWGTITTAFHDGGLWSGIGHLAGFAATGAINGAINYYLPGVGGAVLGSVVTTALNGWNKGDPVSEVVKETITESFISAVSEGVVSRYTGKLTEGLGDKVAKLVNNKVLGSALSRAVEAFPSTFITATATNLGVDAFDGGNFDYGHDILKSAGTALVDAGIEGSVTFTEAKLADIRQKKLEQQLKVSQPQLEVVKTTTDEPTAKIEQPSLDGKPMDVTTENGTSSTPPSQVKKPRFAKQGPKYKTVQTGWFSRVTKNAEGQILKIEMGPIYGRVRVR